ncbi:MAG: hypothetical protein SA339_08245 [Methanomassiliicoccus sp.]|nr:hypothetical protein [Methanomassiliicoccus sp.]
MGDERDAARRLNKAQRIIEYGLAVAVPLLLTLMLYSYVIYNDLFTPLFVLVVVFAALMVVPAYMALRLHYDCWARNTMPQRLATGLVGTIYISAASVFGVSLMSTTKGLDPEQPLTFAVFALLAMLLIAVMAYNSRFKAQNERTDIRFFHKESDTLATEIRTVCDTQKIGYKVIKNGKVITMELPDSKVFITLRKQKPSATEVMVECQDPVGTEFCSTLKQSLDQEA